MLDGRSIIYSSADIAYNSYKLKDHNFKPEIFFSRCNIFVEGPCDEYAIAAISDKLGGIFDKYSIQIVSVGGKDILESYVDIIKAFSISHVAMTDYDYLCDSNTRKPTNRKTTTDFVILPQRLEEVLYIFDSSVNVMKNFDFDHPCHTNKDDQPKSVDSNSAYKIVSEAISRNVQSVRSSKLGDIVTKALEKSGVESLDWNSQLIL